MRRTALLGAVAALVAGCASGLTAPPAPEVAGSARGEAAAPADDPDPAGTVVAAYPDPVATWWQEDPDDLAAGDLAALWSLPLYRTDPDGRRVPALATAAREVAAGDRWSVEVDLAAGAWSDGRPVVAADVVATAEALAAVRPAEWGAWTGATALDEDTVRLDFDRVFAGWPALLSRPPGILPAHVLAADGLDAYADALPVTGGWFDLTEHEPGLRSAFVAAEASPLGRPGLAAIAVLVVPHHEDALGLLAGEEVDVVLGHVALDPTTRRDEVAGIEGGAAFGGTRFELAWDPDGGTDREARRAAASRLDPLPFVEGVLRDVGRSPGGVVPVLAGSDRPLVTRADGDAKVEVVRTVEGIGLLARRLQADLEAAGVATSLVRLDPPAHLERPLPVDGRLRVVRVDPSRSSAALLASVGLDPAAGLQADAEGLPAADPMGTRVTATGPHQEVERLLVEDPLVLPVAEVAVAHAWASDRVTGVTPSGWPGVGFWDAGAWRLP